LLLILIDLILKNQVVNIILCVYEGISSIFLVISSRIMSSKPRWFSTVIFPCETSINYLSINAPFSSASRDCGSRREGKEREIS